MGNLMLCNRHVDYNDKVPDLNMGKLKPLGPVSKVWRSFVIIDLNRIKVQNLSYMLTMWLLYVNDIQKLYFIKWTRCNK